MNRGVLKERFHRSLDGHAQKLLPLSSSFSHYGVAAYDQKSFFCFRLHEKSVQVPTMNKNTAAIDYFPLNKCFSFVLT